MNENKVLIVDDDPFMRKLLGKVLDNMGFSSIAIDDGREAISHIKQDTIKIVITDLNMPGINGRELCELIRARDFGHYVYIVMVTGQNDSKSLIEALQSGADDFISKPLNPTELNARLKSGVRVLELETRLDERNAKLNRALEQIQKEQDEAKSTLIDLLPLPLALSGVSFDWFFEASSFIGGDIFDYFPIDNDRICFYVLDVAGHGVTAAMQAITIHNDMQSSVAKLQSMFIASNPQATIAVNFITEYNKLFFRKRRQDTYFTMFFGLLDTSTGELTLVQAGHPAVIHIEVSGEIKMLGEGALPLGMFEDATYKAITTKLGKGDRLCLYSDGITECENESRNLFGQEKLVQLMHGGRGVSLREVLVVVDSGLKEWKGNSSPYKDDITCLMVEYHGKNI